MDKKEVYCGDLIRSYLPADYLDSFTQIIQVKTAITPEIFFNMAFCQFPKWINWLLKLRNLLVKPFGIDTNKHFTDMICEKIDNEIIVGMPDSHLTFHASLWCGNVERNHQKIGITTVVKYNNFIGRVYFFLIKPFHHLIMRFILKRIQKNIITNNISQ